MMLNYSESSVGSPEEAQFSPWSRRLRAWRAQSPYQGPRGSSGAGFVGGCRISGLRLAASGFQV